MFGRRSGPVADPKARTFGRSVRAAQVAVLKFRAVVRNVPVRVRSLRTFDRNAPHVPKSRAFDPNGLRLVLRIQGVQRVLVVHNDPAMLLARAAGIVTRLVRVRSNRRDNDPATRLARVAGIVTKTLRNRHDNDPATRLARVAGVITRPVRVRRCDNNRSRRRALGRPGRAAAERRPRRDKVTRARAIAPMGEDDLAGSEIARCETGSDESMKSAVQLGNACCNGRYLSLVHSEPPERRDQCPLLRVKRTSRTDARMSAYDPKRTLRGPLGY
jgi:hypothetical protein